MKQVTGKLSLSRRFLHGAKKYFVLCILASAITSLCEMTVPQLIRAAIDCAVAGDAAVLPPLLSGIARRLGGAAYLGRHLEIMAAGVIAVALIQVIFQYTNRVYNTKAAETLSKTMRDALFCHTQSLPYSWHMKNQAGDIIQRCTSDIDTAKNFLTEQLTSVLRILIMLVFSVFFMFSMHKKLAVIALLPMPLILLYSLRFHRKVRAKFRLCDENEGRLSAMAQENLTGARVVRAFGKEAAEVEKFGKQNTYYTGLWIGMSKTMARFWSVSDLLSGLQVLLILLCGAFFCAVGSLSAGEYVAFLSYNGMMAWPIRSLGRMIADLSKADVALERIAEIMQESPEEEDSSATDAPMDGDIRFSHVAFSYTEGTPVLQDVSFTAKAGQTLGILGGTGSGKTTLMLLLDKLCKPQSGQITIGGTDIGKIRTKHLRENIGMVLQDAFLFSRTVAENIALSSPTATGEEIRLAAADAALAETIAAFPAGYETEVGERGVSLSGGQKQRLAIARALVKKAPILVFDDSLSAVDTETDEKIRKAIAARFGKATVILISHRITTLAAADKIVVLENGRIVEEGRHEELKQAGGLYQKIFEMQAGAGGETLE